jgi:Fic family protein
METTLEMLPPKTNGELVNIETIKIMRELAKAHKSLAELKGYSEIVPNKNILINAITLNEAKDSSEIENIITTHDELFDAMTNANYMKNAPKEVLKYKEAIWRGVDLIVEKGFLSINMIVEIQNIIESNNAGIRKQAGTVLVNDRTGEIIYRPPATEREIRDLLGNLEQYINTNDEIDELIKLAVIHYQFESIHPFYDGNGRTGRIINILYLVLNNLIDTPILYLSKYIMDTKQEYYRLLQEIHSNGNWEEWIIYVLKGVQVTSLESLKILTKINGLIEETSEIIRQKAPKVYSRELVELLFMELYTSIGRVEKSISVTRKTASNYLNILVELNILTEEIRGREKVFINKKLLELLKNR